ncbi:unnamed protein product [Closterium sp. Naga37s-1]|nr:unnamed protein product [Closterium sp. Naga37s-1]
MGIPSEQSQGAAAVTLTAGKDVASRTAIAVANWCKARGGLSVDVVQAAADQAAPSLVSAASNQAVAGATAVWAALALAAGGDAANAMLGRDGAARAEVTQWLRHPWVVGSLASLATSACPSASTSAAVLDPLPRLRALNAYLTPRSVLVGPGVAITLADIAVFGAVHDDVLLVTPCDRDELPHLMRWIDLVQHKGHVRETFSHITVNTAKFDPPAPVPLPAKPAAQPSQSSGSGGAKPSTAAAGKAAAAPAESSPAAAAALAAAPSTTAAPQARGRGKEEKKGKGEEKKGEAKEGAGGGGGKGADVSVGILDIRVGQIKKVWKHPNADALYVEEIDVGEGSVRQVVSGLAKFVTEDEMRSLESRESDSSECRALTRSPSFSLHVYACCDCMQGMRVVVLTNVKPGKVRDVVSAGLVLCASNEDHTVCRPVQPPEGAAIGEKITFDGVDGKPEEVLNPKKKLFEKLQPFLRTDGTGLAMFQDTLIMMILRLPLPLPFLPCTSPFFPPVHFPFLSSRALPLSFLPCTPSVSAHGRHGGGHVPGHAHDDVSRALHIHHFSPQAHPPPEQLPPQRQLAPDAHPPFPQAHPAPEQPSPQLQLAPDAHFPPACPPHAQPAPEQPAPQQQLPPEAQVPALALLPPHPTLVPPALPAERHVHESHAQPGPHLHSAPLLQAQVAAVVVLQAHALLLQAQALPHAQLLVGAIGIRGLKSNVEDEAQLISACQQREVE